MKFNLLLFCSAVVVFAADKPKVTVEQVDKTVRKGAYDDREPEDWNKKIKFPMGRADYAFSMAEIDKRKFSALKEKLGEAAFLKIVKAHRYAIPKTEFETYKGTDKLPLCYYVRPGTKPNTQMLIIVAMGEYQPARYIAHIEGIWRVSGVKLD